MKQVKASPSQHFNMKVANVGKSALLFAAVTGGSLSTFAGAFSYLWMKSICFIDLSKAERKKFVESAKLSYTRLHENKLIGSTREYIMHCSPMALKQYVEEKGCRMANLLSNVGGSRKPCGRCDRCRGSCSFTSNLIMRRKESDEYSELRAKFLKLKEILEEMCLVCKSKECHGTVCLKKGCYKCGRTGDADHSSSDCKGKCGGYLKGMPVCHGCLIWKDDILDHDECKNFDCKIGKRLLRLYQHLFRDADKHGYTGTP